uniref:Uncharacterized protein n=1 Tax=viral metagenome TaxID=1070528 RepID=A0A6C0KZ65_9ZZZZ
MKIGIFGVGIVGRALLDTFSEYYSTAFYDIKFAGSAISDVLDCTIVFVCVPTASDEQGRCDLSILNHTTLPCSRGDRHLIIHR